MKQQINLSGDEMSVRVQFKAEHYTGQVALAISALLGALASAAGAERPADTKSYPLEAAWAERKIPLPGRCGPIPAHLDSGAMVDRVALLSSKENAKQKLLLSILGTNIVGSLPIDEIRAKLGWSGQVLGGVVRTHAIRCKAVGLRPVIERIGNSIKVTGYHLC